MSGPGTTPPGQQGQGQGQGQAPQQQQQSWRQWGRIVPRGLPQPPRYRRPPRFPGQLPHERVVWIRRQSKWFLLVSAAPVLLGIVGLALLHLWLGETQPLIQLIVAALVAFLALRWLVTDFYHWFFTYLILTTERVVKVQGLFHRTTQEVVLKSVAQVLVERPHPLYTLFNLGQLHVRPIGTPIIMDGLARPRDVGDSILAMQENPNYGLPPTAAAAAQATPPLPKLKNPKLQQALDELAKPMPMPAVRSITRGQWLTFLARKIPIKFIEGEQVVQVVYRHWIILLKDELLALVILIGSVVLGLVLRNGDPAGTLPTVVLFGGATVALVLAYLTYLNWADDVFVLTTHRVIDVDRLLFILEEYSNDAPYARIQDVRVERGFLGMLLGYGTIRVETSGRKNALHMEHIPHAGQVMDQIFAQINQLRERESVAAINKQKKENYTWLSTLLNEAITSVPDVRGMALLDAASQLRRAGLKMVVLAERHVPGTPSGTVVEQQPSADTAALAESEVRVVVAGQGVQGGQGGQPAGQPATP